jgi:hypothetical protein
MPKTREAFKVQTRLGTRDEKRLKKLVESEGVSVADFVRSAVLNYMTAKEAGPVEESERELVVELHKGVNRLAGLLAQNYLEIGEVRNVLYSRTDPESRDDVWRAARNQAVARLRKRSLERDKISEIQGLIVDEIGS